MSTIKDLRTDHCTIYLITNKINNKKYVGQTWYPLQFRLKRHSEKNNRGCPFLFRAISKYGLNVFTIESLITCLTQEEADQSEIEYIKKYETRNKNKGYNLTNGGQFNKGEMPEETRQRISQKLTGIKRSEESKQKMSDGHIGYLDRLSPEAEANLNASRVKKRKLTMEQAQEIRRLHADGVRGADLARQYGVSAPVISLIINNKTYINNY